MPALHRLTSQGIQRFQEFIDSQTTDEPESFDLDIVTDARFAEAVPNGVNVPETCSFERRIDAAAELSRIVRESWISDPEFDCGLWSWLAWLWFESICPTGANGRRTPGESARWLLNIDWNRYYRHLLAGPWWIYDVHRDDPGRALALLCNPLTTLGELTAQIASRQELVSNPGLVGMLTELLYDPETGKLRRGIGGKERGSARRMAKHVIPQLDMIWDLYSTTPNEFAELLPSEFDRFKTTAS